MTRDCGSKRNRGRSWRVQRLSQVHLHVSGWETKVDRFCYGSRGPSKRPWYAPWRGLKQNDKSGEGFEAPYEWVDTDMRQGLSRVEVENRRKRTGWNELTTEGENMFIKFLTYFTGPILYGQCWPSKMKRLSIALAVP
jgi:magnesium-transporting ATPase (P-type)